jgi:hypothetical protein
MGIGGLDRFRLCPTPMLTHPDHNDFAHRAASGIEFTLSVFISFLATNIRFVNLNHSAQGGQIISAGLAEPLQDKPSRLLGDANFLGKLNRGNALAGGNEEVHGINPLMEGNVRPLKDGVRADGKIFLAYVAAVKATFAGSYALCVSTMRALDSLGPEAAFKVLAARFLVREHLEKL